MSEDRSETILVDRADIVAPLSMHPILDGQLPDGVLLRRGTASLYVHSRELRMLAHRLLVQAGDETEYAVRGDDGRVRGYQYVDGDGLQTGAFLLSEEA